MILKLCRWRIFSTCREMRVYVFTDLSIAYSREQSILGWLPFPNRLESCLKVQEIPSFASVNRSHSIPAHKHFCGFFLSNSVSLSKTKQVLIVCSKQQMFELSGDTDTPWHPNELVHDIVYLGYRLSGREKLSTAHNVTFPIAPCRVGSKVNQLFCKLFFDCGVESRDFEGFLYNSNQFHFGVFSDYNLSRLLEHY